VHRANLVWLDSLVWLELLETQAHLEQMGQLVYKVSREQQEIRVNRDSKDCKVLRVHQVTQVSKDQPVWLAILDNKDCRAARVHPV